VQRLPAASGRGGHPAHSPRQWPLQPVPAAAAAAAAACTTRCVSFCRRRLYRCPSRAGTCSGAASGPRAASTTAPRWRATALMWPAPAATRQGHGQGPGRHHRKPRRPDMRQNWVRRRRRRHPHQRSPQLQRRCLEWTRQHLPAASSTNGPFCRSFCARPKGWRRHSYGWRPDGRLGGPPLLLPLPHLKPPASAGKRRRRAETRGRTKLRRSPLRRRRLGSGVATSVVLRRRDRRFSGRGRRHRCVHALKPPTQ
jgi:hypothetical protein